MDGELNAEERAFREELLAAGRKLDEPAKDLQARLMLQIAPRTGRSPATWWWRAAAAAGGLLVVGGGLAAFGRLEGDPVVQPEPASATIDPCINVFRATGDAPLVDDFEDTDSRSLLVEGRGVPWMLHFDTDKSKKTLRFLRPEPRPDTSPDNQFALRMQVPELRDWGAITQLKVTGSACYDASSYAGIQLSLKGPGRALVGVQHVDATPLKWGGRCQSGCYKQHVKSLLLDSTWQHHELLWSDLRQRGYDGDPLDPTEINSLVVLVHSEDTPCDIWIDNVAFIERR